ncbi:hypothetical protein ACFX2I_022702 [Malus domestica]
MRHQTEEVETSSRSRSCHGYTSISSSRSCKFLQLSDPTHPESSFGSSNPTRDINWRSTGTTFSTRCTGTTFSTRYSLHVGALRCRLHLMPVVARLRLRRQHSSGKAQEKLRKNSLDSLGCGNSGGIVGVEIEAVAEELRLRSQRG